MRPLQPLSGLCKCAYSFPCVTSVRKFLSLCVRWQSHRDTFNMHPLFLYLAFDLTDILECTPITVFHEGEQTVTIESLQELATTST